MEDTERRPSIIKRALALLVLLVAVLWLAKMVIGFLAGLATLIGIVIAVVAVVWALRIL